MGIDAPADVCVCVVGLCVDRRTEHGDEGRGEDVGRQDTRQVDSSSRHCAHRLHDAARYLLTQVFAVTGHITRTTLYKS